MYSLNMIFKTSFFTLAVAITFVVAQPLDNRQEHDAGQQQAFVQIANDGSGFTRYGDPYMIRGANYWHGMWLGADDCNGGDRKRMENEVRQLADMGINNLRIMASSEGPDDQPYRVRPSFMPKPGEYNEAVFKGLDYLLDTMEKYNMTAVSKYTIAASL